MRPLHITALVLAIIGALNWGLVGFFDYDLVANIFGGEDAVGARIVYSVVGIAGLVLIFTSPALGGEGMARVERGRERQAAR